MDPECWLLLQQFFHILRQFESPRFVWKYLHNDNNDDDVEEEEWVNLSLRKCFTLLHIISTHPLFRNRKIFWHIWVALIIRNLLMSKIDRDTKWLMWYYSNMMNASHSLLLTVIFKIIIVEIILYSKLKANS